jgi:aminoglycoside phosphotransferase (APT) family kinase protein
MCVSPAGPRWGDPACDTVIAWTFLSDEGRRVFQARLPVDRATWARGRGWALWKAMIVLVDALRDDPADAIATKHVIAEVLAGDGLAQRYPASSPRPAPK